MRLGFYYHIPAIQESGKILLPGYLGRFLDALAENYEELILLLHVPNPGENAKFDYEIRSRNIKLVSLPQRGKVLNRVIHSFKYTRIIKEYLSSLDALLVRGPTPLLPALVNAANNIPTILLIVGDYLAGVDSLPQPGWRKQLIRLWSWINYLGQLKVAKHSLVFVNSQVLYKHYEKKVPHLVQTHTTTLTRDDFYPRIDTCLTRPMHLLYTGRLDPAKGLLDMVEALAVLVKQGYDLVLDLVGWPDAGSDILSRIDSIAINKGVKDRIVYHGYKAVGPELFAFYKSADIYIIASQSSFEGFPRTIWEAMAHSLPVVATRVGSIPDFITGAAELVDPKDPLSLAAGIKRAINDSELRKNNIKQGFQLAGQNTLEVQVGEMASVIQKWANETNEEDK